MRNGKVTAIVDSPIIALEENELAGEVLLKFYRALGWNGTDIVDPCKVRTTEAVYQSLYDTMLEKFSDKVSVGMAMVNRGPGVDDDIPFGKVYLLEGWTVAEVQQ